MKQLCTYAIMRFMPISETQEFANIGILLISPKTGFIDYKIAPSNFKRVSHFFDDVDGSLYRCALTNLQKELDRVKGICSALRGTKQYEFIEEVTRTREGVIVFSETRALLHETPELALNELYNRYIARDFITEQYRERQMVKALRHDLKVNAPDVQYTQRKLRGEYGVQVELPFVLKNCTLVKAIKPLSFSQEKPLGLIEHGEQWINRIKRLVKAGNIQPQNMLFAIEKPTSSNDEIINAFGELEAEMGRLKIETALFDDRSKIYQFATDLGEESFALN